MPGLKHALKLLLVGLTLTGNITFAQTQQELLVRRARAQSTQITHQTAPLRRPAPGRRVAAPRVTDIGTDLTTATPTAAAPAAIAQPGQIFEVCRADVIVPGCLNYLLHVDIRDLALDTAMESTATLIMDSLQATPNRFTGVTDAGYTGDKDKIYQNGGPKGPEAPADPQQRIIKAADGREVFNIFKTNEQTRKNTILSAHFENNIIQTVNDRKFVMQLVLFVHSTEYKASHPASNGYFFKRMAIQVDWDTDGVARMNRLKILEGNSPLNQQVGVTSSLKRDLPLNETRFQVLVDLFDRKLILEHKAGGPGDLNKIMMVFPLGVGSFNIRPSSAPALNPDGSVNQFALPGTGRVSLATDEFNDPRRPAKLVRNSDMSLGPYAPNSRGRTSPSYYSGRPFLGIMIDGQHYTKVGFHYQIDGALRRAFVSHGCIRVRDKDLYVLDAIVNEGPHREIDVNVSNHQYGYELIDHPMDKINDWYHAVVYNKVKMDQTTFTCPEVGNTYNLKNADGGNYMQGTEVYHTLSDPDDCLFLVDEQYQRAEVAIDFMAGFSTVAPPPLVNNDPNIEGASEGGEDYKVIKRKVCGFLGFNCREVEVRVPVISTIPRPGPVPGPNAPKEVMDEYLQRAEAHGRSMVDALSPAYQRECVARHRDDKDCRNQKRYLDFMTGCYPSPKPGNSREHCNDLYRHLKK